MPGFADSGARYDWPMTRSRTRGRRVGARWLGLAIALPLALGSVPAADAASNSRGATLWASAVSGARSAGSLHYLEVSRGQGMTETIVGDVNRVAGSQVVTIRSRTHPRSETENGVITIRLVGRTAYVKGDVGGLYASIAAPPSVGRQLVGKWISITPSAPNGLFRETAAELTLASVIHNFAMKGPFTVGDRRRLSGARVVALHGFVSGSGKVTVRQTFQIRTDGTPLPVASTSPAVGKVQSTRNVYSKWGEPVTVIAPTGAIPLSSLLSPTTTTGPQVVTAAATSISTAPPRGSAATPTAERV
jgi:hypothetical protein